MAVLGGVAGKITVGAGVQSVFLNKWSMSVDRTIHDTTAYDAQGASSNARTKVGGMRVTTGSASGFANGLVIPTISAMKTADDTGDGGYALVLRDGGTDMAYLFTAIVSNMVVDVSKTGVSTFSFDFTVTGAIATTSYIA